MFLISDDCRISTGDVALDMLDHCGRLQIWRFISIDLFIIIKLRPFSLHRIFALGLLNCRALSIPISFPIRITHHLRPLPCGSNLRRASACAMTASDSTSSQHLFCGSCKCFCCNRLQLRTNTNSCYSNVLQIF